MSWPNTVLKDDGVVKILGFKVKIEGSRQTNIPSPFKSHHSVNN